MEINKSAYATNGAAAAEPLFRTGARVTAPPPKRFVEVLGETSAKSLAIPANPSRPPAAAGAGPPEVRAIRRTVEGLFAAEQRIDALLNAVKGGRTFSAGELLAMQSTVFRYAQTVEIVSRAADRLVGAVKQTLSTQV